VQGLEFQPQYCPKKAKEKKKEKKKKKAESYLHYKKSKFMEKPLNKESEISVLPSRT
jgi:hypothetical protein